MSITFTSNATEFDTFTDESPCLCVQGADSFIAAMDGDLSDPVRADLKANAEPTCHICKGSGIEVNELDDRPSLNLSNANARVILRTLGIAPDDCGDLPIADARRALMRARSRGDLSPFARPEEAVHGRPRAREDGSIELRPLRLWGAALDADGIQDRIERFARLVEESASRKATLIMWG